MDPPRSLHKSTISPSGSDLCPVRDTCNWGRAVAALLEGVHVRLHARVCTHLHTLCVSVCRQRAKCWQMCLQYRRQINLWSLLDCRTFFPLSSSSFLPRFPLTPFTPPSSPKRFHYPLKGLNGVRSAEYKAEAENRGKRALRDSRCLS